MSDQPQSYFESVDARCPICRNPVGTEAQASVTYVCETAGCAWHGVELGRTLSQVQRGFWRLTDR